MATHPFPIDIPLDDRDDEPRVEREKASVQRTWQSLGFEPFREDLWVMKPHLRAHHDAAEQLEAAFSEYLVFGIDDDLVVTGGHQDAVRTAGRRLVFVPRDPMATETLPLGLPSTGGVIRPYPRSAGLRR